MRTTMLNTKLHNNELEKHTIAMFNFVCNFALIAPEYNYDGETIYNTGQP